MEDLIIEKFKSLTESGKLDEIVTKQVTSFIDSTIRDSLSSYSDVRKSFKEKLNSKIIESFEKLDFVQYSKTLTDLIESELTNSVIEIGIAPAKEMIQNFVGSLEKKEWKLSEIIEKYKEAEVIPQGGSHDSGQIAFIGKRSEYGSFFIGFDEEESVKKQHTFQCKYQLMVDAKTNKLYSPTIQGVDLHPLNKFGIRGFDLFLFKLYAMGCTVVCDVDDIDVYWSTYND